MNNKYDVFFDKDNEVYQVRTKSDVVILEFIDPDEEKIFLEIMKFYDSFEYLTFEQIKKKLEKDYCYSKIMDVIEELSKCEILNESNFEYSKSDNTVLYPMWFKGLTVDITNFKLSYLGVPNFGKLLKDEAEKHGYRLFNILSSTNSINDSDIDQLFEHSDFVIVDASKWSPILMDIINKTALRLNKPWCIIQGMIDQVNYSIGPIFHGKETGCYDCLESRLSSNDLNIVYTSSYKKYLMEKDAFSQKTTPPLGVDNHMSQIIVQDIHKYISGYGIPEMWKNNLLFNTINYTISKHYMLKAPLCNVCNPQLSYNPSPWLEAITLKEFHNESKS